MFIVKLKINCLFSFTCSVYAINHFVMPGLMVYSFKESYHWGSFPKEVNIYLELSMK